MERERDSVWELLTVDSLHLFKRRRTRYMHVIRWKYRSCWSKAVDNYHFDRVKRL